jgi:actin
LDIEQVRRIKEEKCNVAFEYSKELEGYEKGTTKSSVFELPDGENFRIQLDEEVIKIPESCFDSGVIGKYTPGLHELVFESIRKCENEVRRELFGNVILSGGNTLLNGFVSRMNKE